MAGPLIGQLIDRRIEFLFEFRVELLKLIVIMNQLFVRLLKVLTGIQGQRSILVELFVHLSLLDVLLLEEVDALTSLMEIMLKTSLIRL